MTDLQTHRNCGTSFAGGVRCCGRWSGSSGTCGWACMHGRAWTWSSGAHCSGEQQTSVTSRKIDVASLASNLVRIWCDRLLDRIVGRLLDMLRQAADS